MKTGKTCRPQPSHRICRNCRSHDHPALIVAENCPEKDARSDTSPPLSEGSDADRVSPANGTPRPSAMPSSHVVRNVDTRAVALLFAPLNCPGGTHRTSTRLLRPAPASARRPRSPLCPHCCVSSVSAPPGGGGAASCAADAGDAAGSGDCRDSGADIYALNLLKRRYRRTENPNPSPREAAFRARV